MQGLVGGAAPVTDAHVSRKRRVALFLGDWAPLVVLLVAYESLRDLVPIVGAPHHDLGWIDRALFGGQLPSIWLQTSLYRPAAVQWQDVFTTWVYFAHYRAPLVVGLLWWFKNRAEYHRFAAALLTLCALAFVTYTVMPTIPPWLGVPGSIHEIAQETIGKLNVPGQLFSVYTHRDYNLYAAFPSLHAAFPVVLVYYGWLRWRFLGAWLLLYASLVGMSIVYLGEHYVVDILGGVTYAIIAIVVVESVARRLSDAAAQRRQPAAGGAPEHPFGFD